MTFWLLLRNQRPNDTSRTSHLPAMGRPCRMVLPSHRAWVFLGRLQSPPLPLVSQSSHFAHFCTLLVGPRRTLICEPCFRVRTCWPRIRLQVPVGYALGDEINLNECPFLALSLWCWWSWLTWAEQIQALGLSTGSGSRVGLLWFYAIQGHWPSNGHFHTGHASLLEFHSGDTMADKNTYFCVLLSSFVSVPSL